MARGFSRTQIPAMTDRHLFIRPEAYRYLNDARDWYDRPRKGLGLEFESVVDGLAPLGAISCSQGREPLELIDRRRPSP